MIQNNVRQMSCFVCEAKMLIVKIDHLASKTLITFGNDFYLFI